MAVMIGLSALGGVAYMAIKGSVDQARVVFQESIWATQAVRKELGIEASVTTQLVEDRGVNVKVELYKPPADVTQRRDLVRSVNIIVRRTMHNVKDVKVVMGGDGPAAPPPGDPIDGGDAVAVPVPLPPPDPKLEPKLDPKPEPSADPKPAAAAAKTKTKTSAAKGFGLVTLVTFPEAEVFRSGRPVGRTPLFNEEWPTGTHLLTLVGADGLKHRLSLKVMPGKNTPVKVNLSEVPTK